MINRRNRRDKLEFEFSFDALRDEVQVLREVLDEIREAQEWKNNNAADFPALGRHQPAAWSLAETSLPAAESNDDAKRIAATAASIPSDCPTTQRGLF